MDYQLFVSFICMILISIHQIMGHVRSETTPSNIIHDMAKLNTYLSKPKQEFYQIPYNAIEQCSNHGGLDHLKNAQFSLKFQLINKCDGKGILICYPSMLDQKNSWMGFGMTPDVRFRVTNQLQNSSVASRCHEEWTKCKKEAGKPQSRRTSRSSTFCGPSPWHGILLRTLRNDENGERRIVLTTTIGVKEYDFGSERREFSIVLADRKSLISFAEYEGGDRIPFEHDDALMDAYVPNITRGTHLRHYGGLWMLGLDMLPFHQQQLLHLHVFRDCGCEMHAWFLRPEDLVPARLDHLPELPSKCAIRVARKPLRFALPRPATIGCSVRFSVRWNNKARRLIFFLANGQEKQLFAFMLDRTKTKNEFLYLAAKQQGANKYEEQRSLDKYNTKTRNILNGTTENGTTFVGSGTTMHFEIAIRNYLYEFCVQGVCFQRLLRRAGDWWLHKEADRITKLTIWRNSDVYPDSVDPPIVVRTAEDNSVQNHCENSYLRVTPFQNDCTFWLRGIVNKNSTFIHIELLHNVPTYHEHLGAVVLSVKFDLINSIYHVGYHIPRTGFKDQIEQNNFSSNLFQPDQPFECRIVFNESLNSRMNLAEPGMPNSADHFKIFVFTPSYKKGYKLEMQSIGRLKLPIRAINYVHVVTDVYLINKAMHHCEKKKMTRRALQDIWPPVVVGDRIVIRGKLLHSAQVLNISLLHDRLPFNDFVGDVPLRMVFDFTNRNLSIYSWILNKNRDPQGLQRVLCRNCINTLHPDEEFTMHIILGEQWFIVMVRGKQVAKITQKLPPWALNAILVEGDYNDAAGGGLDFSLKRSRSLQLFKNYSSLPYVAISNPSDLLRKGDVISVIGTLNDPVNGTAPRVNISLLYESLETYDRLPPIVQALAKKLDKYVGLPLIMALFDGDQLTINHNCLQPHLLCKQIRRPIAPLKPGKSFHLTIVPIAGNGFTLTLAGNSPVIVENAGMPPWTAQYIRLEGDLNVTKIDKKSSIRTGCEI